MLSALAPTLMRRSAYVLSASVAAAPLWSKCQMGSSPAVAASAATAAATAAATTVAVGKTTPNPPPDASRGATADLCDVHYPDPVDVLPDPRTQKVQIAEPVFR